MTVRAVDGAAEAVAASSRRAPSSGRLCAADAIENLQWICSIYYLSRCNVYLRVYALVGCNLQHLAPCRQHQA